VKRHGLWNHDLTVFVTAAKQQSLQFDTETSATAPPPEAPPTAKVVKPSIPESSASGNGGNGVTPAPTSELGSIKEHVARKRRGPAARLRELDGR
jgi:hypothetical protein